MGYAIRKKDEDTKNPVYQSMSEQAASLHVKLDEAISFVDSELLNISEETLHRFFEEEPDLQTYKRAIWETLRKKEHILSPEMEKLLASAGELSHAPSNIFSLFNNADLTFPPAKDSEGREYPVSNGSYVPLLESSDETLRKSAFESLYCDD